MGTFGLCAKLIYRRSARILSFACLTVLLCVTAGLLGGYFLHSDKAANALSVAIVDEDNTPESRMLYNYLTDFDGYRDKLSFRRENHETASALLDAGTIDAVILVPAGFTRGVMTGENHPFIVRFNSEAPLRSGLIRLFADAYADMLRTGQIGVYTTLDAAREYGTPEQYERMFLVSNMAFLRGMLERGALLETQTLPATDVESVPVYYAVSALVFFTMLGSVLFLDVFSPAISRPVLLMLRTRGGSVLRAFVGYLVASAVPFAGVGALLGAFMLAGGSLLRWKLHLSPVLLVGAASLALLSGAFLLALSALTRGIASGCIAVGAVSLLFLFLSGGVIPSVYLSTPLQTMGKLTPHYWLRMLLLEGLEGGLRVETMLGVTAAYCALVTISALAFAWNGKVGQRP